MIPVIPIVITAFIVKLVQNIRKPQALGSVPAEDMLAAIEDDCETKLTDTEYRDYGIEHVDRFVENFNTPEYQDNFKDCDNRAVLFYALIEEHMPGCMCGWEWVMYDKIDGNVTVKMAHALNIFIDKDRVKWYIDIGSKKRFTKPAGWVVTFRYI